MPNNNYDDDLKQTLKRIADALEQNPNGVKRVTMEIQSFDKLIASQIPYANVRYENFQQAGVVELDGPAKDSDQASPYEPSIEELASVETSQQLLWWYFGGKPYRITKALRIPYNYQRDGQEYRGSLFIGYQGPGF
jgi:hypothetical protein